ncbi:MAG TPA: EAL domain-containing protein [Nitrosospira sp.]|nr:EAL domain-containing protein [Nitrosospira sp.]
MTFSPDIFNASILVVDDRENNVELIRSMLRAAGYVSVSFTTNPLDVCGLHRRNRYDLILLDLMMPKMDGFQVMEGLKEIEEFKPGESLPVLVITAQAEHKKRALQAGAKGFISKPFDRLEVLTHIRDALEIRLLQKVLQQSMAGLENMRSKRTAPLQETEELPGQPDGDPQREEADRRLPQLAHYDALTNLPNRTLFYESLKKTIRQAEASLRIISVLYLDIDDFKNVNDTLGRAIGDEVLRQFSVRLLECLRVTDMVARLGGDEFGCILFTPDASGDAGVVASKIRESLRQPFEVQGNSIMLTASMGISIYPSDSLDPDTLVKNGDTAMYRSKKAGRDTYRFFTAEMNTRAIQKLEQENALRKAVERNEFVLHYQPKVELLKGQITGVEALIRWNRPGYGFVPPSEFISVLEQTGLINQVGAWVLETACKQIAEWKRVGIGEIPVSVNVSGRQFSQVSLKRDVIRIIEENNVHPQLLEFELQTERALRENSIDSDLLELELTESSLMTHARKTISILKRLKGLGIRISVDDFGTGYSSLAYVKRFPIDVLKIDRSFVMDIITNPANAAITTAIIEMAHSLDVRVVAEGVETVEQLDFLRERGCDEIQGYYFAPPLPASEISKLLLNGNTSFKLAQSLAS